MSDRLFCQPSFYHSVTFSSVVSASHMYLTLSQSPLSISSLQDSLRWSLKMALSFLSTRWEKKDDSNVWFLSVPCAPPPPRRWDVRTELRLAQGLAGSGHTQYLIIGSRRTLILGLRWVKILILLTCTLPWVKKTMTTTISRRWVSFSQICLFKLL